MSLIAWYPLNGDLSDRLGGGALTCANPQYGNGKIHKSLHLAGCDLSGLNPFIGLDNWSLSLWLCDNGSNNWCDFVCFSDNLARLKVHEGGSKWTWYNNNTASGGVFPSGTLLLTGLSTQVWKHIIITKQENIAILYVDGVKITTTTSANNFTEASAKIHFNSRANAAYGNINIEDIRYFNHALEPREIKELSKGLLLHYSFNDLTINPNIFNVEQYLSDSTKNRCTVAKYGNNGFSMVSNGSDPYVGTSTNSGGSVGANCIFLI